jgi:ABC-2 type transport system ATP-binding protein
VPASLGRFPLTLEDGGRTLVYSSHGNGTNDGKREVAEVVKALVGAGIGFEGIETRESSLEDIFVDLVEGREGAAA